MHLSKILTLSLALGLAGCAASPALESYPRRQIERPYALPKGVATWETHAIYSHAQSKDSESTQYPIPIPLIWRQSLSNNWNLIWAPIPLAILHQTHQSESHTNGFTFAVLPRYSSVTGWKVDSDFSFDERYRYRRNRALDFQLAGSPHSFNADSSYVSVAAGPVFQVTDDWIWGAHGTIRWITYPSSSYAIQYTSGKTDEIVGEMVSYTQFPLSLWTAYNLSQTWEVEFSCSYARFGYEEGFEARSAHLTFINRW